MKTHMLVIEDEFLGRTSHFEIVIIIENGETPSLHLDIEQIEFANSIKAEFDTDLYANLYVDPLEDWIM